MIYVIRATALDRSDTYPQWVFMFEGGLELVFSAEKAWPFNLRLATQVCSELMARYGRRFTFAVESLPAHLRSR